MNWLLLATLAGYGLAIIGLAGWYVDSKDLKKTRISYWNERDDKIKEIDRLDKDLQGTRATIKARDIEMGVLHGEKMQLHAENADLREALQEAQAEIKALNMQTIEVPEVAPAPVKRTRKKAGAQ